MLIASIYEHIGPPCLTPLWPSQFVIQIETMTLWHQLFERVIPWNDKTDSAEPMVVDGWLFGFHWCHPDALGMTGIGKDNDPLLSEQPFKTT